MKKNYRRGFSLAELLIALGIISIIATLGISIGKRGVEKAFNKFFYSAYNGINSIIIDANSEGTPMFSGEVYVNDCPGADFETYLESNLLETGDAVVNDNNPLNVTSDYLCFDASFRTTNGISVTIRKAANMQGGGGVAVPMMIGVPAANKKRAYFEVYYLPNDENLMGIIIPTSKEDKSKNIYNIQDRADLLPFYLDDGTIGRVTIRKIDNKFIPQVWDKQKGKYVDLGTENAFTPFEYRSFKDAYCNGVMYHKDIYGVIDCSGYSNTETGIIRPAKSKKIF